MSDERIIEIDPALREFERRIWGAIEEELPAEPEALNGRHQAKTSGRPGQQAAGFTYVSLADLLDRPEPAHRFIIDELLPLGGSSLLVAKPKVGKTQLALQATRDVAAGTPFLSRATVQGTVLYHAFEEKDDEVARTMRRAGSDRAWPIYFHFAEIPRERLAALRAAIGEHKPILVVIDTLAHWMQVQDFSDYAQVGAAMRPLHALARETDCHILAVHHAGKTRDGIDSPLGSTALTANVDTIMVESETDQGRTLETKQRYGTNLARTLLQFDPQTGCLSMGDGVAQSRARDFDDEVLTAVADGKHLETEIRAALRCGRNPLLAALNALVEKGLLRRTGTGRRNSPYMYELEGDQDEDDGPI